MIKNNQSRRSLQEKNDLPRNRPVAAKVFDTLGGGELKADKVVDSKRMTPAPERNVDELKDSRRGVAAAEAALRGAWAGRNRLLDEVCEQWGYSHKHAIELLGAQAG